MSFSVPFNFIYLVVFNYILQKKGLRQIGNKKDISSSSQSIEKQWLKPVFPDLYDQRNPIIVHPVNSLRNSSFAHCILGNVIQKYNQPQFNL